MKNISYDYYEVDCDPYESEEYIGYTQAKDNEKNIKFLQYCLIDLVDLLYNKESKIDKDVVFDIIDDMCGHAGLVPPKGLPVANVVW